MFTAFRIMLTDIRSTCIIADQYQEKFIQSNYCASLIYIGHISSHIIFVSYWLLAPLRLRSFCQPAPPPAFTPRYLSTYFSVVAIAICHWMKKGNIWMWWYVYMDINQPFLATKRFMIGYGSWSVCYKLMPGMWYQCYSSLDQYTLLLHYRCTQSLANKPKGRNDYMGQIQWSFCA